MLRLSVKLHPESVPNTQIKHSQIPWQAIIAMRNRLVHAYFEIDYDQVWAVIVDDLPWLIEELESILQTEEEEEK
jgi:uncharacterized protein with HEPN domain